MPKYFCKWFGFFFDYRLDLVGDNDYFALFKLFDKLLIDVVGQFVVLELYYFLEVVEDDKRPYSSIPALSLNTSNRLIVDCLFLQSEAEHAVHLDHSRFVL